MTGMRLLAAACAASSLLPAAGALPPERPYDFRRRLESVHRPGIRDASQVPAEGEFAFRDGDVVAVPAGADEVMHAAARDFSDYLLVSHGVSVRVAESAGVAAASVAIDETLLDRQYSISVGRDGLRVAARDGRAAAQALYHLEDLMSLRGAPFLVAGSRKRRSLFSPRIAHSGYGLDVFPEGHLSQMAHAGIDAIAVFVRDVHLTQCAGRQHQDLGALIRRAARHGLDTYIYSYVDSWIDPAAPNAEQAFDAAFGSVAAAFPEARGIILVGESCRFPSRDERTCFDPQEAKSARSTRARTPAGFRAGTTRTGCAAS